MSDEPYVEATLREVNDDDPKWMRDGVAWAEAAGVGVAVFDLEWSDEAIAAWNAIEPEDKPT